MLQYPIDLNEEKNQKIKFDSSKNLPNPKNYDGSYKVEFRTISLEYDISQERWKIQVKEKRPLYVNFNNGN